MLYDCFDYSVLAIRGIADRVLRRHPLIACLLQHGRGLRASLVSLLQDRASTMLLLSKGLSLPRVPQRHSPASLSIVSELIE